MHRINLHHIDLLRKAFPNADVYHSEIIKDEIFEDIDLTFEKHISREKLPLDDMQEPLTMIVHLYEKSYVLPSRKAYCDQLITLRKLFVDVKKNIGKALMTFIELERRTMPKWIKFLMMCVIRF